MFPSYIPNDEEKKTQLPRNGSETEMNKPILNFVWKLGLLFQLPFAH